MRHVNELYDDIHNAIIDISNEYLRELDAKINNNKLDHKLEVLHGVDMSKSLYEYIADELFENQNDRKVCAAYLRSEIEGAGYKLTAREVRRAQIRSNPNANPNGNEYNDIIGEVVYVNYYLNW